MTESEARLVLNLTSSSDSEDILEAYEEAVFEQASFFMRRVFIPKLAKARMAKLEKIELAAKTFELDLEPKVSALMEFDFSLAKSHQEVLEIYNQAETQIKLVLSNTSSATRAIDTFHAWIELFEGYAQSFLSFCEFDENRITVKLTEAPVFVEYKNASAEEKSDLIKKECARLSKLQS